MEPNKNRRNLLLAILAFAVIAGAILVIVVARRGGESAQSPAGGADDLEGIEGAFDTTPDISTLVGPSNPLEKLPDVNPVEAANPFSDLDTNPFR